MKEFWSEWKVDLIVLGWFAAFMIALILAMPPENVAFLCNVLTGPLAPLMIIGGVIALTFGRRR